MFIICTFYVDYLAGLKKYKCVKCGKSYSNLRNLNIHYESIHKGKKKFSCLKCKKEFPTPNALIYHVSKKICSKRPQNVNSEFCKCDLCNKTFTQKSSLKRHISSVHEGIKHKCHLCNKMLSRKGLLNHIMTVHEGASTIVE